MTSRAYYSASLGAFQSHTPQEILGRLTERSEFPVEAPQRHAWLEEIAILKVATGAYGADGWIALEYAVPRLGRRIDAVLILAHAVLVLEFKVGESVFRREARDQVWDYALDLKNFHEPSHRAAIVPILVATKAQSDGTLIRLDAHHDGVLAPTNATPASLPDLLRLALQATDGSRIDGDAWSRGRYSPTPTIIEAAMALYRDHQVEEISRSDAGAINLRRTSAFLAGVIERARREQQKVICFVTGVPGSGKTLVGLDVATRFIDRESDLYSVFLSGNGPLVAVLREALARDRVRRARESGNALRKSDARRAVDTFVQNVHHFRDECLQDETRPPHEHVVIFDEAQRAWTLDQTSAFMARKKGRPGFGMSEPEYLISCMDRHETWAVVICLVGQGQEINTGEAGIGEWISAIRRRFDAWYVCIPHQLHVGTALPLEQKEYLMARPNLAVERDLHLEVSMRSFRSERLSEMVHHLLLVDLQACLDIRSHLLDLYPIVITRDLERAKRWLRTQARGSERFGLVCSSQAARLRPHAIDVRATVDPVHWFLDSKEDVRSSYFLEDVATEFQVQGLELDWVGVVWDGDLRIKDGQWEHWSFVADRWQRIRKPERQSYLLNAYRVLLTRARQGMVIVVPNGAADDHTRPAEIYDATYRYLQTIGFKELN